MSLARGAFGITSVSLFVRPRPSQELDIGLRRISRAFSLSGQAAHANPPPPSSLTRRWIRTSVRRCNVPELKAIEPPIREASPIQRAPSTLARTSWTAREDAQLFRAIAQHFHLFQLQERNQSAAILKSPTMLKRRCSAWAQVVRTMSERDDETTRPRSAASCRARWAYLKRMNRTPLWARYLGSADERIRRSAADVQIITMEKTAEHDVMASANVTPSKLFPRRRLWTASEDARLREAMSVIDSRPRTRWNHVAEMVRTRDALQCLKRWQLIREQTPSGAVRSEPRPEPVPWSMDEDRKLWDAVHTLGRRWRDVQTRIDGRSAQECCWRYNALIRQLQRRLQENRGRCKTTAYRYWTREESAMLHQVVQEYSAQAAASDSHIYWPAVALEFTTRMQQVNGNYVARNTGSCRAKHYFDIIRADRQVSENTARSRCRGWLPHEIARLYIAMEEEDSLIASNPHPATPRKRGPQGLRGGDYWKHVSEALRDGDPAIHRSMAACMGKFYRDRAASADGELYETAAQRSAKRHRRAWSPAEVTALDRIVTKRLSLQHDIHWPSVAREMGELVPGSRRTSHQCRSKYRNDSVDGFDRVFNEGVARMGG